MGHRVVAGLVAGGRRHYGFFSHPAWTTLLVQNNRRCLVHCHQRCRHHRGLCLQNHQAPFLLRQRSATETDGSHDGNDPANGTGTTQRHPVRCLGPARLDPGALAPHCEIQDLLLQLLSQRGFCHDTGGRLRSKGIRFGPGHFDRDGGLLSGPGRLFGLLRHARGTGENRNRHCRQKMRLALHQGLPPAGQRHAKGLSRRALRKVQGRVARRNQNQGTLHRTGP
mmetsp:Transcript_27051/g.59500  ORF Transcript_27051/g.59500 Transcript_27051/m.59500 type:complete len:224 (+) Transcript_27051:584-1255(+)